MLSDIPSCVDPQVDADASAPAGIPAPSRAARPLTLGTGSPAGSRSVSPSRVRAVRAAVSRVLGADGSGSDSPLSPSSGITTPGADRL